MVLLAAAGGCLPESNLPIVKENPFLTQSPQTALRAFHAPATEAVALRVNSLGQKILQANPDVPVRPAFQAIGSPQPEIFHRETSIIFISEGLANKCLTEAQLAAVLCLQLGKMMSQREAQVALKARRPDRDPPVSMPVGPDSGGTFGSADGVHLAELGKFQQGRRPHIGPPPPPPDPKALARMYLSRAGYQAADLEAVGPLLREADRNNLLEKQLGGTAVRPWIQE
jgi:hypothetical protein